MRNIGLALIAVALFFSTLYADTIILKNGREIRGKIVEETDASVTIEVKKGLVAGFARKEIKEIVKEKSPREIYQQRIANLDKTHTEAYYKLAIWCNENGLNDEAGKCFETVIALDPDHPQTRQELGYERYKGDWVTYEEKMRLEGLVKHKGKWVKSEKLGKLLNEEEIREWKQKVKRLIRTILATDSEKSELAEKEYVAIHNKQALSAIVAIATHKSDYIRYITVKLLGSFDAADAVEALTKCAIQDSHKAIRKTAVESIRAIGSSSDKCDTVYQSFLNALYYADEETPLENAIEALCWLKDRRSVEPLIETVTYEVRRVKYVPDNAPAIFTGSRRHFVVGYQTIACADGSSIKVPILGRITTGAGVTGLTPKLVDDVIFNLATRNILREITNEDFNYAKDEWRQWWQENKEKFDRWLNPLQPEAENKEEKQDKGAQPPEKEEYQSNQISGRYKSPAYIMLHYYYPVYRYRYLPYYSYAPIYYYPYYRYPYRRGGWYRDKLHSFRRRW